MAAWASKKLRTLGLWGLTESLEVNMFVFFSKVKGKVYIENGQKKEYFAFDY